MILQNLERVIQDLATENADLQSRMQANDWDHIRHKVQEPILSLQQQTQDMRQQVRL